MWNLTAGERDTPTLNRLRSRFSSTMKIMKMTLANVAAAPSPIACFLQQSFLTTSKMVIEDIDLNPQSKKQNAVDRRRIRRSIVDVLLGN